ncbi:MAG: tyrosine-type recombinase/integrase [Thermoplasmata archaeon]|nr:tyrosine-type recombinase/integrase [Thermoplasmata archaeon]
MHQNAKKVETDAILQGTFFDIRSMDEYREGHIEGAVSVPMEKILCEACLEGILRSYGKNERIIIYGNDENEREMAKEILIQEGFKNVEILNGDIADLKRKGYPHKFRITNITHMAEHGLDIKEIQAQSGHKDTKVLMEYIQYSSKRIRKSYDSVFEDGHNTKEIVDNPKMPEREIDEEYYKRLAIKKFLDGEIDRETLNEMLKHFEKPSEKPRTPDKVRDIAYC